MDGPLEDLCRGGAGGGWKLKKLYSCKAKDTGKEREIIMKKMNEKNSCSSKFLHPCHNFFNGLTLTVSTREKHFRMAWKIC